MNRTLLLALILLGAVAPSEAQVRIGIGAPGVSIGVNLRSYPRLTAIPGYPVYYAPDLDSNYFFYDGMYWVFQEDNWYASSWYNGPWGLVDANVVPDFVLRVPVRYYRHAPVFFRGWRADAPPRWGEHWGTTWAQQRRGWDTWHLNSAPRAAPLPAYQRQYSGDRYPRVDQQPVLHERNYRYEPHDAVIRQHYEIQRANHAGESPRGEDRGHDTGEHRGGERSR
jgi:hypothetical protein